MSKTIAIVVGLVLLVSLLLYSMTYTVSFHEVAIKTRFGQTTPDSIVRTPGLKFRLPLFADKVTTFDTRLQVRESVLDNIQTSDGQQVVVRAFLMWNVDTEGQGPLNFFRSFASVDDANQGLLDQFRTAIRTGISRFSFADLLGDKSRLQEAEGQIMNELAGLTKKGIQPRSVGLSQMLLPSRTTTAVVQRMNATRAVISESERYKGDSEATGIQSEASSQADKIRNFAAQRAAEIRSIGDKDAAKYLADMSQDQDLAVLLAWLDALQATLSQNTTMVLPTSMPPLHLLQPNTPVDARGIPMPTGDPLHQPVPTGPASGTPTNAKGS